MVGAAGTLTLAVMTRASLGHTGNALVAWPATQAVYAAIVIAALARICSSLEPGWSEWLLPHFGVRLGRRVFGLCRDVWAVAAAASGNPRSERRSHRLAPGARNRGGSLAQALQLDAGGEEMHGMDVAHLAHAHEQPRRFRFVAFDERMLAGEERQIAFAGATHGAVA